MASVETFTRGILILFISLGFIILGCCECPGEHYSFFNLSFPVCFPVGNVFLLTLSVKLKQLNLGIVFENLLFSRGWLLMKVNRKLSWPSCFFSVVSHTQELVKTKLHPKIFLSTTVRVLTTTREITKKKVFAALNCIFITISFSSFG